MQTSFEWHIQEVLKNHKRVDSAVDHLLRLWRERGCLREDSHLLFRFLYVSGYHLTLNSQIPFLIEKKFSFPWLYLLELFYQHEAYDDKFLENFFIGVDEESLKEIIRYHKYDRVDMRFDRLRTEWLTKDLEAKHNQKKELLDKLQILKHERMLEEEKKVFTLALEEFPADEEIASRFSDFQKRYADNLFQRKESNTKSSLLAFLKREKTNKNDPFVKEMLQLAKKYPDESYWIASSLFMAECYSACIGILEGKLRSEEEDWLLLEAYIQEQKYLVALNLANLLEEKYKDQPDLLMSALYFRAISLHNLEKTDEALQILHSILTYNKDFKLAQYLYEEWSE